MSHAFNLRTATDEQIAEAILRLWRRYSLLAADAHVAWENFYAVACEARARQAALELPELDAETYHAALTGALHPSDS